MLVLFVLLVLLLPSSARRLHELRRRSVAETPAAVDGPGYYLVQFRGAITAPILRRLTVTLGYEPHDYVPNNALLIWLHTQKQGDLILRTTPHITWIGRLNSADRRLNIQETVQSMHTQFKRFRPAQVVHPSNASSAPHLRDATSATDVAVHSVREAFDHDVSGTLTLRLRIESRNMTSADLLEAAQDVCRTRIKLSAPTQHDGVDVHMLHNVHTDDAERVATALSEMHGVRWIEARTPFHSMNRWSVGSMQRLAGADQSRIAFPLRGKNQLLSVSDTGVETDTCFFHDTKQVPFTSTQQVPPDTQHRKVRAYWSGIGGDFRDQGPAGGHGTHVAGTAVGLGTGAARNFSGGAPDSRLVFVDLHPADAADGFLDVPLEIGKTLFQWSHDVGARVHSASWGGDAGGRYTSDEQAIDRFIWNNRHFVAVFAAGNSGPDAGSIASPANAKNVLTIGATMNGIDAVRLAQTTSRPADDYSPDWLAAFSSRGSKTLAFRKPDLVAPGGAYIWSSAFDGPTGGVCEPLGDVLLGLQGTSMATPLAGASAVLVREYFGDKHYKNRARIASDIDPSVPTGSLIRAILVASAAPLRGVYPRTAFSSVQQRIDAGGHGRIALDRALDMGGADSRVLTAVIANEESSLGLALQRSVRWCVDINGTYDELIIAMAYADYPSLPMAKASLVNDLRLRAIDGKDEFAVNEQPDTDERRSTIERIVVAGRKQVTVVVQADTLGFGDVQTFSLVLVLRNNNNNNAPLTAKLTVSAAQTDGSCIRCASRGNIYVPSKQCAVCGDGVVDPVYEECDSAPCCNSATCKLLRDNSPCSIILNDCRVAGRCAGTAGCVPDKSLMYLHSASGICDAVTQPPSMPPCQFLASSTWAKRAISSERQLCCKPLRTAFEQIEFDRLFAELAREYAAAQLNADQPGQLVGAASLLIIESARKLLETRCGVGFLDMDKRTEAMVAIAKLRALNEACGDKTAVVEPSQCAVNISDQRVCLGGGVYDQTVGSCLCHTNRHPGEPDCRNLACSGNGVSLYDYVGAVDRCTCFEGWSGPDCSQCASPADASTLYHCVGVPLSLRQNTTSTRRYIALIQRVTLADRLDGSFYKVPKYADVRPGKDDVDCWCREVDERIAWRTLDSHRDAVITALAQRASMAMLGARSEVLFGAAPTTTAITPRPKQSSGAASMKLGVGMLALLGLLLTVQ